MDFGDDATQSSNADGYQESHDNGSFNNEDSVSSLDASFQQSPTYNQNNRMFRSGKSVGPSAANNRRVQEEADEDLEVEDEESHRRVADAQADQANSVDIRR
jgi:hypothetical protein